MARVGLVVATFSSPAKGATGLEPRVKAGELLMRGRAQEDWLRSARVMRVMAIMMTVTVFISG